MSEKYKETTPEMTETPCKRELDGLSKANIMLEDLINGLEDKLEPFLSPALPRQDSETCAVEGESGLICSLISLKERFSNRITQLQDVRDRVVN